MKIRILGPEVYNQIAAGEVVDRPYSVVKELVENAIDAGSTEITVEIEGGGKSLIRVTDNGGGIAKDDLVNAFLPHATSKLQSASDLFGIATLGFRGEAIASIAAVSHMKIVSRVQNAEAFSLAADGGVLGSVAQDAGAYGTEVTVRSLFYNTPARMKFMKTDHQEEGDVTQMMARFILSRPGITFHYLVNGKTRFRSYGDGLAAALAAVYGAEILGNLHELDADKHGIRLHGFIGNRFYSKPNRTYQSLFVNGRYVVNQTVAAAATNAYASYLMKRQYPFYVLFLDVPPEIVDVNVHPNKADVRFADNQVIYGSVYSVISAVLDGNSRALEYLVRENVPETRVSAATENAPEAEPHRPETVAASEPARSAPESDGFRIPAVPKGRSGKETAVPSMTYEEAKRELAFDIPPQAGKTVSARRGLLDPPTVFSAAQPTPKEAEAFEENRKYLLEQEKKQQRVDPKTLEFKGELFRTYLFYECGDDAYLVDQHAAHERIIYDKLRAQMESRTVVSQPMLMPFTLTVNAQEYAFLEKNFDIMREIGFEIEEFGPNCIKVSSVPADLMGMDLDEFFKEVLSGYESLRAIKLADILKDKLATAACKAAVKGGNRLTEQEVRALLERMDGNMGLKCPHGRPVAVHIAKSELEKLFKRIV